MGSLSLLADWMGLVPWGPIFAFDFGRYLLAALTISLIVALAARGYLERRRVRGREPAPNQRREEFWRSLRTALVFSIVGLGIYYGIRGCVFWVYPQATQYGWGYWFASLALIVVAHDAYFYWMHRALHRPAL